MNTIEEINQHIEASREREKQVTPAPWEAPHLWDSSGMTTNAVQHKPGPGERFKEDTTHVCEFPKNIKINRPNAAFIAASRTELPAYREALAVAITALSFIQDDCVWQAGGDDSDGGGDWRIGPACSDALTKIKSILLP